MCSTLKTKTTTSLHPDGGNYVASDQRNSTPELESFQRFFELWLVQQNNYLEALISASKQHNKSIDTNTTIADKPPLQLLINQVIQHYEYYYQVKSWWAKKDVLSIQTPSWTSTIDYAFMWIGGWRPTMAFHLLYSKSGIQLEDQLADFIQGLSSGDLGDLSPSQLNQLDKLQMRTIKEERNITEKMAKHHETVADSTMVGLSHAVTELMRSDGGVDEEQVELALMAKEEGLEEILHNADDLLLRTLKAILDIVTPMQAVHFLIAAAELHLRFHDWGKKNDARQHHGTGGN